MSNNKSKLRRSGAVIMANLILLLGSLAFVMVLAVINGSIGFICAMGVTLSGAVGVAKALGEPISLSYGVIIGLGIGCGVLRARSCPCVRRTRLTLARREVFFATHMSRRKTDF